MTPFDDTRLKPPARHDDSLPHERRGGTYHLTVDFLRSPTRSTPSSSPVSMGSFGRKRAPTARRPMGSCAAGELVALGPRCGAPMLSRVISPLHTAFPHVKFSASDGQHWRVHGKGLGAWYFASVESHPGEDSIGRFDLCEPLGTCYVGTYDTAVAMEVLALAGLAPAEARDAVADRQVSAMALDAFYGKPIADFTSPLVEQFGAPGAYRADRARRCPAVGAGGVGRRISRYPVPAQEGSRASLRSRAVRSRRPAGQADHPGRPAAVRGGPDPRHVQSSRSDPSAGAPLSAASGTVEALSGRSASAAAAAGRWPTAPSEEVIHQLEERHRSSRSSPSVP